MKQKFFVLLALGLTVTTMSFAQGFHLGIKGGVNIDKINGTAFNDQFNFGYNLGVFSEIKFSPEWGLQPELNFNQLSYRTGSRFSDVYPTGINDAKGSLNYLTIPVLLTYSPSPVFSFQLGPQFGTLMNQHETVLQNSGDAFKKHELAALGGVQLNLGTVKLGGRYYIGLNNLNDINQQEKWTGQGFQVYLGFRIL